MNEDEIYQMEREEPPRPNPNLTYQPVHPVLTRKQYNRLVGCYMTPDMGPKEIEPKTVYFDPDQKQIKFLLLPKALPNAYSRLLPILQGVRWQHCARAANGQKHGKKITVGWLPQIPGRAIGSGYYNVRTKETLDQPQLVYGLRPLLREMEEQMQEFLPVPGQKAWEIAISADRRAGEEDDLSRVPTAPSGLSADIPNPVGLVKNIEPWNLTYTLFGTSFSTVELNRNIIFKAHEDKRNVPGALICITTLGTYEGGRLVFPRYGYSAELQPTDLLICDNNRELHGNMGPLVGTRYSLVAYFHVSVLEYTRREGHWKKRRPKPG